MARIQLNVPLVAQEKANCCWHTSAYMIWLYWQQNGKGAGPMNTISSSYAVSDSKGIGPAQFITLAQKVGLSSLPVKNHHSEDDLFGYLRDSGPVWCAGFWFGFGHIIVLTGVDKGNVYFNDPDGGVKKEGTVKWFNEKLSCQLPGCLMVKDPKRY
jgi:ABC-type bacteriocin/lantibiotic exporter with double-glycine peptidase domain